MAVYTIKSIEAVLIHEDKKSCCLSIIARLPEFFVVTSAFFVVIFFSSADDTIIEYANRSDQFLCVLLYRVICMDERGILVVNEAARLRERKADSPTSNKRFNVSPVARRQASLNIRKELPLAPCPLDERRQNGIVYV